MKKLMIAAAIVCAAAMSHAAPFLWTSEKIYLGVNGSTAIDLTTLTDGQRITPPTSGTKGYADGYANITWTAEMILSTAGVEDEKLTPPVTFQTHKINTADVESNIFALPTVPEVGKTYSWEVVITGTWKDADNKEWTVVSDAIKGSKEYFTTTFEQIAIGAPAGWTVHGPGAIPEPTSGLLLLLGVAGLALRRKQK